MDPSSTTPLTASSPTTILSPPPSRRLPFPRFSSRFTYRSPVSRFSTTHRHPSAEKHLAAPPIYDPVNSSLPVGIPESRTWRPWPLRWPFLVGFIFLCIVLGIGIELVLQGCAGDKGCHSFHTNQDYIPSANANYFIYNQLPMVLSLILNLVWAIPHHDIIRLEPYFRMSAPGGTSAADSLFLDYPYTFALLVPFIAAKRRHYQVLLSSCIALTMSFIVTPLIAGIFDEATLSLIVEDTARRGTLRPVDADWTLSGEFTYDMNRIRRLDLDLPEFITFTYAVLPIRPNPTTNILTTEIWTANTTRYRAELKCEPAGIINITSVEDRGVLVKISSKDGAHRITLCDQKIKNDRLIKAIDDRRKADAKRVADKKAADKKAADKKAADKKAADKKAADQKAADQKAADKKAADKKAADQKAADKKAADQKAADASRLASQSKSTTAPTTTSRPPVSGSGTSAIGAPKSQASSTKNSPRQTASPIVMGPSLRHVKRNESATPECDGFTTFITPWTAIAQRVFSRNSSESSSVYLFGWASGVNPSWPTNDTSPHPINITALFCTTRYYSEKVTARFEMPDGKLISVNSSGKPELFLDLLNFDDIINGDRGAFASPEAAKNRKGALFELGYRPAQALNTDWQLQHRFGSRPANVSGLFAPTLEHEIDSSSHSSVYIDNVNGLPGLALSTVNLDQLPLLLDPDILQQVYNISLSAMFALAMRKDMVTDDWNASVEVQVSRSISGPGFQVNILWARGAQSGLVVVILMATLLTVRIVRKPCNLDGEPNSLGEALRLLAASPDLAAEMENAEFHRPEDLAEVFKDGAARYTLDLVPGQGPRVLQTATVRKHSRLPAPGKPNGKLWVEQLWQLRGLTGMGFMTFFGVVGIVLLVVFRVSRSLNGLQFLGDVNSILFKFWFSYVPTVIGMVSDPILIAIATCQYMLAPYRILTHGPPASWKILTIDYDKSPPHFQIVRFLRTKNFPLAALAVSILLCKVLAVALAGLFSVTVRNVDILVEVSTPTPPFIAERFKPLNQEMYYLFEEHLPDSDGFLPFVNSDYFFIPVLTPVLTPPVESYEASTIGISLDINCSLVPREKIILTCDNQNCERGNASRPDIITDYTVVVGDPCWGNNLFDVTAGKKVFTVRYSWSGLSHNNIFTSSNCSNKFFPLWLELSGNPDHVGGNLSNSALTALIMECEVGEKAFEFDIVVGTEGRLINTTSVRALEPQEMVALYVHNATDRLGQSFVDVVAAGLRIENSPDGDKIRWLNYLMRTIEPGIVRPGTNMTHIPDAAYIVDAFETVYRRLFAIQLMLSRETILHGANWTNVTTNAVYPLQSVEVNRLMFSIAGSIVLMIMVVLGFLYWRRQQTVGYSPRTLAGLYALLYASNAKEECGQLFGRDPAERAKGLDDLGGMYACEWFADGAHYGVHRTGKSEDIETREGRNWTEQER